MGSKGSVGELAQMVECLLSMREVVGSMPAFSKSLQFSQNVHIKDNCFKWRTAVYFEMIFFSRNFCR